jgi:hypothetical protein
MIIDKSVGKVPVTAVPRFVREWTVINGHEYAPLFLQLHALQGFGDILGVCARHNNTIDEHVSCGVASVENRRQKI